MSVLTWASVVGIKLDRCSLGRHDGGAVLVCGFSPVPETFSGCGFLCGLWYVLQVPDRQTYTDELFRVVDGAQLCLFICRRLPKLHLLVGLIMKHCICNHLLLTTLWTAANRDASPLPGGTKCGLHHLHRISMIAAGCSY